MQAKAPAERDVKALLCGFETTSNRSWPNESWIIHVNNPWLDYGWLWSHRWTTHCTGQKKFFTLLRFLCQSWMKSERPSLNPRRFLNVRFKKLSTNQNRGIAWLRQGCTNTTLGTRLMKLCKCGYPPRANCRDCLDSIPPKNIYICKYQGRGK